MARDDWKGKDVTIDMSMYGRDDLTCKFLEVSEAVTEHLRPSLVIDNDVTTDNLQSHGVTNWHLRKQDDMS